MPGCDAPAAPPCRLRRANARGTTTPDAVLHVPWKAPDRPRSIVRGHAPVPDRCGVSGTAARHGSTSPASVSSWGANCIAALSVVAADDAPATLDACRRCGLWEHAPQPVPGAAPAAARIMLAGQPGSGIASNVFGRLAVVPMAGSVIVIAADMLT
ncbi:hypothetical protein WS75_13115 [Burkholderia sp. FL-7-2-10-S1-D7]|nr:hypothetical protein WS75_13115 [Burkholderia sp. FL-7-2-10-S1-D7]